MNIGKTKLFIDGIESVSVVDGIVRIALFNYLTTDAQNSGQMPPLHEELMMNTITAGFK